MRLCGRSGFTRPLGSHEAFFGGRTNAVQLSVRVNEATREIRNYDYRSLYPYINKTGLYPLGHPEFIYDPDMMSLDSFFRIAKCSVLPSEYLFHPALPYRSHQTLTFPLCWSCVKANIDLPLLEKPYKCSHADDERVHLVHPRVSQGGGQGLCN